VIGLVIVAHGHRLAEGVKELAEQITQGRVPIAAAGGLDETTLGTSAERVLKAINQVYHPDGVLVLMDLGSAVLSARLAVELLPADLQPAVRLSDAPLVEGAIAAAVEASLGSAIDRVEAAARTSAPKLAGQPAPTPPPPSEATEVVTMVPNKVGLHARPAAQFVQTAARFRSEIAVRNLTRGGRRANAKSIFAVLGIGAQYGDQIAIGAVGDDAAEALAAIRDLVERGFGELEVEPQAARPRPP